MMASGVGWRAMAALSGATLCTCERLSRDGSAWLPRRGVHALHTVFLFRLSPKVGKNRKMTRLPDNLSRFSWLSARSECHIIWRDIFNSVHWGSWLCHTLFFLM